MQPLPLCKLNISNKETGYRRLIYFLGWFLSNYSCELPRSLAQCFVIKQGARKISEIKECKTEL